MRSFYLPTLSPLNRIILIVLAVCLLLGALLELGGLSVGAFLGLSPVRFFSGHFHQLLTFAFLPEGLLGLLFNGLILWFLGSELEDRWGSYAYGRFLFLTVVGQGLFYLGMASIFLSNSMLFAYSLSGLSGFCTTLCLVYGVLFPHRILYFYFFPVKAKWFVLIIVFINFYQALPTRGGIHAWAQIGAMLSGFFGMLCFSKDRQFRENLWGFLGFLKPLLKTKARRGPSPGWRTQRRKNLRIVEDLEKDDDGGEQDKGQKYH